MWSIGVANEVLVVSCPDPTSKGGKGSGELGTNPWSYTEKFPHTNRIAALALSYD